MKYTKNTAEETGFSREERVQLDRWNARMRHFQGVAAGVMDEALGLWLEIQSELEDPRTPEEIIDGIELSEGSFPRCGWPEFREKLHLLGHYLDYARRLCDGSIVEERQTEEEVF